MFKLRAVWININYRYVEGGAPLPLHQRRPGGPGPPGRVLAPRDRPAPRAARPRAWSSASTTARACPLGEGTVPYEEALAAGSPRAGLRPPVGRRLLHPLHRRHHRHAQGRGLAPRGRLLRPRRRRRPDHQHPGAGDPRRWWRRARGGQLTLLPIAPLMHGATQWCVMGQSFVGNRTVLVPKFDPHEVWRLVESEKANSVMITGDAMGKPLIEALDEPGADYDLSSLLAVTSSAALFSRPGEGRVLPATSRTSSSSTPSARRSRGNNGMATMTKGDTAMKSGPTVTRPGRHRRVRRGPRAGASPGRGSSARSPAPATSRSATTTTRSRRPRCSSTWTAPATSCPATSPPSRRTASITLLGRGSVVDQLRRREDLPRGGRVGRALAPRRARRHRGAAPPTSGGASGWPPSSSPGASTVPDPRGDPGALPRPHRRLQGAPPAPRGRDHRALPERQARLPLGGRRSWPRRPRSPTAAATAPRPAR